VFGTAELIELLSGCGGMTPDEIAGRIEAAVLTASEGRLRDDMAILAFGPTRQTLDEAGILPGATSTEETDG